MDSFLPYTLCSIFQLPSFGRIILGWIFISSLDFVTLGFRLDLDRRYGAGFVYNNQSLNHYETMSNLSSHKFKRCQMSKITLDNLTLNLHWVLLSWNPVSEVTLWCPHLLQNILQKRTNEQPGG